MKIILSIFLAFSLSSLMAQSQIGQAIYADALWQYFAGKIEISGDGNRVIVYGSSNVNSGGDGVKFARVYEKQGNFWQPIGSDIMTTTNSSSSYKLSISNDGNRVAIGDPNYSTQGRVRVYEWTNDNWSFLGGTLFGFNYQGLGTSVSFSGDGSRLAVAASSSYPDYYYYYDFPGSVQVYELQNDEWEQLGQTISGSGNDNFGLALSLSDDGNHFIAGAPYHQGINFEGDGYAQVYEWSNNSWVQKGDDLEATAFTNDSYGTSVDITGNGNRIVIGDPSADNSNFFNAGKVRTFNWNPNGYWSAGTTFYGEDYNDAYGGKVDLSEDGNTLAFCTFSNTDNIGQAFVYEQLNDDWIQTAEVLTMLDTIHRGGDLSLSDDGETLVFGFIGTYQSDEIDHFRVYNLNTPNLVSTDNSFTIQHNPAPDIYILEGNFSNCNIFILDENENVVQFLLNQNDKIIINLNSLDDGLHFIRVQHQEHDNLFVQEIIKQ